MRVAVFLAAMAVAATVFASPTAAPMVTEALLGSPPSPESLEPVGFADVPEWWGHEAGCHVPGIAVTAAGASLLVAAAWASTRASVRAVDGGPLGDARVKRDAEAVAGSLTWDGKEAPDELGFVYGFVGGRYLYDTAAMSVVVSSTGGGKSRYINYENIDLASAYGATLLVTDAKNTTVQLMQEGLEKRGYAVLLLDAQGPSVSSRYNPVSLVARLAASGRTGDAQLEADNVASAIVPDERGGSGSHWVESARALVSAAVYDVATNPSCPDSARNMASVARLVAEGTEAEGEDPAAPLKAHFREMPPGSPARVAAGQLLSAGGQELRSVVSTAKRCLRPYASGSIAWMTSGDDLDVEHFAEGEGKVALFCHAPKGSPANGVFTVLFNQLYRAVTDVADRQGGSLARPLVMLADEIGNLPPISQLGPLLSLGRSYGVRVTTYWQTLAQAEELYGKTGREVILANSKIQVALTLGSPDDWSYFTRAVGVTTRHVQGTSTGRSGQATSSSTSWSEHADPVIHEHEWKELAPDRDGAIVVKFAENGAPASRCGTICAPLADATRTPAAEAFGLGSRERDAERIRSWMARAAERRRGLRYETWTPEWPENETGETEADDEEWEGLD